MSSLNFADVEDCLLGAQAEVDEFWVQFKETFYAPLRERLAFAMLISQSPEVLSMLRQRAPEAMAILEGGLNASTIPTTGGAGPVPPTALPTAEEGASQIQPGSGIQAV